MLENEYLEAATTSTKGPVDKISNDLTKLKANVAITKVDVKKTLLEAEALILATTAAGITTNEDA